MEENYVTIILELETIHCEGSSLLTRSLLVFKTFSSSDFRFVFDEVFYALVSQCLRTRLLGNSFKWA